MRIDFKRIEIHNFMSFADEVFEFSKFNGMNLVCGKNNDIPGAKNGTGKSALWSALIYCLFGETPNKLKNENIHNRYIDSKEVRVVTYFTIEDCDYKVATGFNKYGAAYCQVTKTEDGNDIDLTKSSIIETRKLLEKEVLRCDITIFLRTIMLSSDQTYNFFRLRKGEKKEFIEKLFDISVFGDMYNAIHRDILDSDKDILQQQSRLMMLNKNNDDYKDRMLIYDNQQAAKLSEIKTKLDELNDKLKKLKEQKVSANKDEASKYEDLLNKIDIAMQKLAKLSKDNQSDMSKLELSVHKLDTAKEQKQKVIDKHAELLGKLCDDCSSIFKKYYSIDTYQSDIEEIGKKTAAIKAQQAEKKAKQKELAEKLDKLAAKQKAASKKLDSLTSEYVKANKEMALLESRIESLKSDENKTLNEENPYSSLLESNNKQIAEETKSLEATSDKYKYLKFAESIVSQDTLRKFIIKDLIGLLNNKIKTYLMKLGAKYTVEFDADMDYEFITEGGTCEYDNFSAGERQRIMIATCFAFRDFMAIRNALSSNILILDEFIDGNVDQLAIEGVISILKDFIQMYKQNVWIVSHRKEIDNSIFDNIIQVQKTNNISKIAVLESV